VDENNGRFRSLHHGRKPLGRRAEIEGEECCTSAHCRQGGANPVQAWFLEEGDAGTLANTRSAQCP